MKTLFWPLIILLSLQLMACSAPDIRDELNADELSAGASVALLPLNLEQPLQARVFSNPVKFAGTAGRLAAFKGEETRQRRLRELVTNANYDFRGDIADSVRSRLVDAGIKVEPLRFRRSIDNVLGAVPPGRFEKRLPRDVTQDAILDVYVDLWGYIAEGVGDPYLPTVHVGARLLRSDTLEEIYLTRIEYHPLDPAETTVALPADARFEFESSEAMSEDPDRAVEGLRVAVSAVVDQLLNDLIALSDR